MSAPTFHHDEPGTSAALWSRLLAERDLPRFELPTGGTLLVVVGAHPDDETLGAAGLVDLAHRAEVEVEVVSATAGEGSHPASPSHTAEVLARRRRGELEAAVAHLAPRARVSCLGLPDGDVARHEDALIDALVRRIGTRGATTLLAATWRHDGHPDHEAVGRAAAVAARRTGATLVEYPVWLWHWGNENDLPWPRAQQVVLDHTALAAKRAAVAAHASQVRPLSDLPGDEVLLGADLLAHFDRDHEIVFSGGDVAEHDALDRVRAPRRSE